MSSPVSLVVANLGMEAIEELAINTTAIPPKYGSVTSMTVFALLKGLLSAPSSYKPQLHRPTLLFQH